MRYFIVFVIVISLFILVCSAVETTEAVTTIVVDVDLTPLNDSLNGLSSDIQDLNSAVQSMASAQESLLVECNELQEASVKSTDSTAIAILIFIGIILSFSITIWLFRK